MYGGDYKERFELYTEEGKDLEAIVREISASEEFDALIEQTIAWRTYVAEDVFREYEKGNVELARKNLAEKDPMIRELMAGYEKLAKERRDSINEVERIIVANGVKTLIITVIITILVIILSITAALITSPIIKVMERMKWIASGDLSHEVLVTKSQDEVGQLVAATNQMRSNIHDLLREINFVSSSITAQSGELTQSADEVNAGSQQIAAV